MLVLLSSAVLTLVFLVLMAFLVVRPLSPFTNALKELHIPVDIGRWDGTVDRGPYAVIGAVLFAVKHNIDRFVAALLFKRPWSLFNYWVPSKGVDLSRLGQDDALFYGTLLVLALPFIWIGVALTLRRLRSASLPSWLVCLFFLPVLNLLFFILLAIIPAASDAASPDGRPKFLDRIIPKSAMGATAVALVLTLPLSFAAAWLCTTVFKEYGWGLFVGIPFCQGLAAALLHSYHQQRSLESCVLVSSGACVLSGAVLLVGAVEGMICLAMALPFAFALSAMGGAVGYAIQKSVWARLNPGVLVIALFVALPFFMGAEFAARPEPPLWAVRTAVDIQAPPAVVWKNVVAFAEMPAPKEWLFRSGLAYPMRAVIDGRGPGAVRHCVFSTGEFVEPIELWEEPRLLKFSVTAQPASMQEWSPYGRIEAPHLHNYLVSKGGQFLLTPLPGGGTRLEGTTWYRDYIWPSLYWKLWSDFIIHRIHLRVLRHIRANSEK